MQGGQDFTQPSTTSAVGGQSITKDQAANMFYASNGTPMMTSPFGQPMHPHHPQMFPVATTGAMDADNAAFAGFRRLLAELSKLSLISIA